MSKVTALKLREWLDVGRASWLGADEISDDSYLFVSAQIPSLSEEVAAERVDSVASAAGVQAVAYTAQDGTDRNEVHPHLFRRSFCSRILRNGCNLAYLSDVTGDSIEVLKESYLTYDDSELKEAMDKYR